jgi:hypothetical protein
VHALFFARVIFRVIFLHLVLVGAAYHRPAPCGLRH